MNVLQRVLDVVELYAEKPFLIDSVNDRVFNFKEFHRLAGSLAQRLKEQGIRRGDRIGIVLNNSAEFVVLYFASLYLGAVVVPANPQLHTRDIDFILGNSGIKCLIYSPSTKALTTGITGQGALSTLCLLPGAEQSRGQTETNTWSIDRATGDSSDRLKPLDGVSENDLFSITFTSGTTSLPKGVAHRIGSMLQNAMVFNEELGFDPESRFYHILSMSYMAGLLNTLLCPFLAGASVVISRAFDARLALEFWDVPIKYGVNTLWLVPTILSALIQIDRSRAGPAYCREHIRTICVGTAPLPLKIKQAFENKYGAILQESYGLSETLFVTTNSNKLQYLPGSAGCALPGVSLKILDDSGAEAPTGKDGEIFIRTPALMAGYLNYQTLQPDELDSDEWFPSGDVGHLAADSHLFITDRIKDLIIRGGVNISPRAIEDVLMRHESIDLVAVIGIPQEFYGEEVVAVMKLKAGYTLETVKPALERLCRENLSATNVPTRYVTLDEFPTSTTGKIQKAKLRELLAAKPTRRDI